MPALASKSSMNNEIYGIEEFQSTLFFIQKYRLTML
jgi:hypothetical protein